MDFIKTFFLYGLVLFFILSLTKNIIEYQRNLEFYYDYKTKFEKEKASHSKLQTDYIKAQDINEFEKIVRNKLNLHKKGETMLVIPNPTPILTTPSSTPAPIYRQWLDVFSRS